MNKIVGLKELRANIGTYINQIGKGESFLIVRKSNPVFKLVPPDEEEMWETVANFTKIRKGGVSVDEILKRM